MADKLQNRRMRPTLFAIFLLFCLGRPGWADPFTFATPEQTWATLKYSLDTKDFRLFQTCFSEASKNEFDPDGFEKFLAGDGRFAQTSRVVGVQIEGDRATLSIDFYCRERDGRLLVDNDPVRLIKEGDRWLLDGL
jgi:hypothetical protein